MPNTTSPLQMETTISSLEFAHNCSCRPEERASHRPCACGVARMDPSASESPCFEKKMTHTMLQRNQRVLVPATFIRTHGYVVDTVVSFTGPNGHTYTVAIKKYPPIRGTGQTELRSFLGTGWKEFVKENGFQVGDCVLFRLVGNSCFHVLVSSKLQENAAGVKTSSLSKRAKERGLGKSVREDGGIIPQTKLPRLRPRVKSRDPATIVPNCESNCNPRETRIRPWRGIAGDNVKAEAVIKHPQLPATDDVKHPGLDVAAIGSNSGFPQFSSKLSRINVSSHDIRLEIPYRFAKEHGHKFQQRVCLLGPNGQWRIVKIRISSSFSSSIRVQFRDGWRAFSDENGFTEGDVLIFSLVEFSKFRVQVSRQ